MTNSPPDRTSTVPRLVITQDNQFWFEAARAGRLVIQRCADCGVLRHPPTPVCQDCRSLDWGSVTASGAATLHSYCVVHHPQDPAFDYPLAIGLADLPEGVRMVADIAGIDHRQLSIGMPLQVIIARHGNGELLPQLRSPDTEQPVQR